MKIQQIIQISRCDLNFLKGYIWLFLAILESLWPIA